MISDWETQPSTYGDAFIVAPDDTRAGIVWEVGEQFAVERLLPPKDTRYGVWNVTLPEPLSTDREGLKRNLALMVEALRAGWEQWAAEGIAT
jgi:hypothetical protein